MTAIDADTTGRQTLVHTRSEGHAGSLFGSDTSARVRRPARHSLFWLYVVVLVIVTVLPTTGAAQSDPTVPLLRSLKAVTVVANIYIDGSARNRTSPCRIEPVALERHGAEMLHDAGLDAIGAMDKIGRMHAIVTQSSDAFREWQKAPLDAKPPDFIEQSKRRESEMVRLGSQPFLSVHVGVAALDAGICAAGITTEFRAFARDRDESVINYNGESVRAPIALWSAPPLALAVPATELARVVTERLDSQLSAFVTAWTKANGH